MTISPQKVATHFLQNSDIAQKVTKIFGQLFWDNMFTKNLWKSPNLVTL